ncbi:MAG TPA: sulfite exporter TauE/SafE family protein [Chryseosolibacter sp.]
MEDIMGYFAAGLIGIALGLIGGGGSILTVPVLVYLFHIEPTLATAYSLFIVGTTSLVGGIKSAMKNMVDFRTAIVFAIPSFVAVYLTRRFVVPVLPDSIITIGSFVVTKDIAIMIFFGFIMLVAAISMIRKRDGEVPEEQAVQYSYSMILVEGTVVGALTGIVGAGGGFLILPALVLFAKLPMKKAVGTSLIIIAAKSLIGFLGDIGSGQLIDFRFILIVSSIAIVGIFLGTYTSKFIESEKLKSGFGWFVLVMGVYVILNEVLLRSGDTIHQ